MMIKVFATGITLGAGGNGGNFAPFYLWVLSWLCFSKLINLTGLTQLPVSNFTMVGMAGILSGLFHAHISLLLK
jgi:CIC family chloride channel protein